MYLSIIISSVLFMSLNAFGSQCCMDLHVGFMCPGVRQWFKLVFAYLCAVYRTCLCFIIYVRSICFVITSFILCLRISVCWSVLYIFTYSLVNIYIAFFSGRLQSFFNQRYAIETYVYLTQSTSIVTSILSRSIIY